MTTEAPQDPEPRIPAPTNLVGDGERSGLAPDKGALIRRVIDAATVPEGMRFDVKKAIARGGVAVVWLTYDRCVGRSVAMKLMHADAATEPILVHGFFREAQVMGQLNHPNVVPVHEVGLRQERPYFTMGLVLGQSLATWLETVKPGDYEKLADFLTIITKVCDALEYAHSRSVVHCDLKPANIMVGSYGEVYLMDWGGAQPLDRPGDQAVKDRLPPLPAAESEGKIFGTASYMSPQQANAERPDPGWDVFSMGAIIYRFITGHAPFQAEDSATALAKAQVCDFTPLVFENHGTALPRELLRVVNRAMARQPEDRYASIAQLKSDLCRIISGGGTFPVAEFAEGAEVIAEGDTNRTAYIVQSGTLEAYRMNGTERISLRTLKAGDVFGEMAMFASTARTASVRALTAVRLLCITEEVLSRELDYMSPWMATFVRTLAERFAQREMLAGPPVECGRALAPTPESQSTTDPTSWPGDGDKAGSVKDT